MANVGAANLLWEVESATERKKMSGKANLLK
jgi:hypothetical protein